MKYSTGDIIKLQSAYAPFYVGQEVKVLAVNEERQSVNLIAANEPCVCRSNVPCSILEEVERGVNHE